MSQSNTSNYLDIELVQTWQYLWSTPKCHLVNSFSNNNKKNCISGSFEPNPQANRTGENQTEVNT